ncbi:hypothetical protein C8A00DRAFT_39503 [Chaetomidium leptoderma]|uniref:DUF7136 domain-containing protein n=1 Tax=Chaetomidium leptoderma TaxID=669021 RepID=A0AAN7A2T4_9PEZI|nr:hypothetical protein C8A00DRAFT_39503 [Chaetomidium leptoderma]
MRLFSRAAWSLVAWLSCLGRGTIVDAAAGGILEFDVVFPRNETYAPTDSLPVVFAFQNAELAQYLIPQISYTIHNQSNLLGNDSVSGLRDLTWANWSSHEPYFSSASLQNSNRFATEGSWRLTWRLYWESCDEGSLGSVGRPVTFGEVNSTGWSVDFTLKAGGQPVDLTCPEELGVAINVTGTTFNVSGGTCMVVPSVTPTTTPNPCLVKVDSAAAASMSAAWHDTLCQSSDKPADCSSTESTGQRLAVAGTACLAAAFGALGFLLA